ncbi:MAG TPA: BadF/BadG/BcrA/BcrD ATPase family protein [Trebonia sp.]|nr:BadF/BadG/BcrA/BcrD ATPase family protein [Trebonia sp.]
MTDSVSPAAVKAAVLAIDGGNSKTALALVAADGTVLASLRGPDASQEAYGVDKAMRIIDGLVRELATRAGIEPGGLIAQHTSACLAGADLPEEEDALTAALCDQGWSESAIAINDTFAVLRAGLRPDHGEPSWGAAVTCGAGINCVAVGPEGQVARYLSFGRLSGDWGGGRYLAGEVVWHAVRAEDGRGPDTALAPALAEHFGFDSASEVAVAEHKGQITYADLLPLTRVLLSVATAGDPVAREILRQQAEEICVMVTAALRRIGLPSEGTPVVLGGGVLEARNDVLLGMITDRLSVTAPGASPRVVDVPPIAGAALLGLDHIGAEADAEHRLRREYPLSCDCDHKGGIGYNGRDPASEGRAGLLPRRSRRPHVAAPPGGAAHEDNARRRGTSARAGGGARLGSLVRAGGRSAADPVVPGARAGPGQDHADITA